MSEREKRIAAIKSSVSLLGSLLPASEAGRVILGRNLRRDVDAIRCLATSDFEVQNELISLFSCLSTEFSKSKFDQVGYTFDPVLPATGLSLFVDHLKHEGNITDDILIHVFVILNEAIVGQLCKIPQSDAEFLSTVIIHRVGSPSPWVTLGFMTVVEELLYIFVDKDITIFPRILVDTLIGIISPATHLSGQQSVGAVAAAPDYVKEFCLNIILKMSILKPSMVMILLSKGFMVIVKNAFSFLHECATGTHPKLTGEAEELLLLSLGYIKILNQISATQRTIVQKFLASER